MSASPSRDTWAEALDTLDEEERKRLTALGNDKKAVLDDLLLTVDQRKTECSRKQWRASVRGKTIVVRDVLEKLAAWVTKFVEVGDMAVQFDPVHAALPWAAVRFILKAGISDVETFSMVAEDIEGLANVITRCSILESLYMRGSVQTSDGIAEAVVVTYAAILKYLAMVLSYLEGNTAMRFLKATFDTQGKLEKQSREIDEKQEEVLRNVKVAQAERMEALVSGVAKLEDQATSTSDEVAKMRVSLHDMLDQLNEPIKRMDSKLDDIHDQLKEDQRAKIVRSISTVPFPRHHKMAARDRLADSGQWLLEKRAYQRWRTSSESSILWLHGIPGSGKTKLTSLIIDQVKDQEHLAFFYCARDSAEPLRAEADQVLACLVRQLCCTSKSHIILEPVVVYYRDAIKGFMDFDDHSWTAEDSLQILQQLLPFYPAVTIVIDALDEVNQEDRSRLVDALNDLVSSSGTLVKVFISSRDNYDIVLRLQDVPNVYIHMDENAKDVERFIDERLSRAKLLRGTITPALSSKVQSTLRDRAQGMFRMVDLQIQTLSLLKTAADIEARLNTLPATLQGSYQEIYDQIQTAGEHAFDLAKMTFQWLLATNQGISLSSFAALTPFWPGTKGVAHTASEIQDTCAVLISFDEKDFKFSHLSVREFFYNIAEEYNDFKRENADAAIASACISYLMGILSTEIVSEETPNGINRMTITKEATDAGDARDASVDGGQKSKLNIEDIYSINDMPEKSRELNRYVISNWHVHTGRSHVLASQSPLSNRLREFLLAENGLSSAFYACERVANSEQPSFRTSNPLHPVWIACDNDILDLLRDVVVVNCEHMLRCTRKREAVEETALWYAILEKKYDIFKLILSFSPKRLTSVLPPDAYGFLELRLETDDTKMKDKVQTAETTKGVLQLSDVDHAGTEHLDLHQEVSRQAEAIFNGNRDALSLLVRCLAVDEDLLVAAEGYPNLVHSLLSWGVGHRLSSKALIKAISSGHAESAAVLIAHGAEKEQFAVVSALRRQLFGTAIHLIKAGFDINGRYLEKRRTALHYAAESGRMDIVEILLDHDANVRRFDIDGRQPHHLAAKFQHWDIVRILQQHGADLDTPDKFGWKVENLLDIKTDTPAG